jgi:hypothetical protein
VQNAWSPKPSQLERNRAGDDVEVLHLGMRGVSASPLTSTRSVDRLQVRAFRDHFVVRLHRLLQMENASAAGAAVQ